MPRTFLAFPVLEKYWAQIQNVQKRLEHLGIRSRLIKPENFHVTVAYLGELSIDQITQLDVDLKETFSSYKPLTLTTKSITGFPLPERTRAVAIKLSGRNSTKLQRQVSQIRQKLQELDVSFESLPFIPHISIGRIARGSDFSGTFPLTTERTEILLPTITMYVSYLNRDGSMSYSSVSTFLSKGANVSTLS